MTELQACGSPPAPRVHAARGEVSAFLGSPEEQRRRMPADKHAKQLQRDLYDGWNEYFAPPKEEWRPWTDPRIIGAAVCSTPPHKRAMEGGRKRLGRLLEHSVAKRRTV